METLDNNSFIVVYAHSNGKFEVPNPLLKESFKILARFNRDDKFVSKGHH